MGIPDRFIHHSTQEELHAELGLDALGIYQKVQKLLKINKNEEKIENIKITFAQN